MKNKRILNKFTHFGMDMMVMEHMDCSISKKNFHLEKPKSHKSTEDKIFNKKKYREEKYSNKYKIDAWKGRKKTASLRVLLNELEKGEKKNKKITSFDSTNRGKHPSSETPTTQRISEWNSRKKQHLNIHKDNTRDAELHEHVIKAMKAYKQKRAQIYKNKKLFTKRGQPVMKQRLQLMLDKIKLDHQ